MSISDKDQRTEERVIPAWPFPTNIPPKSGGYEPEGVKDVALLVPSTTGNAGVRMGKEYPTYSIPDLDASYILSSDGSTRPAVEGH